MQVKVIPNNKYLKENLNQNPNPNPKIILALFNKTRKSMKMIIILLCLKNKC